MGWIAKEMVGFCGLISVEEPVLRAEVHIVIDDKDRWDIGHGREANKMLNNYKIIELGLNPIYSYILKLNDKNQDALGKKSDRRL